MSGSAGWNCLRILVSVEPNSDITLLNGNRLSMLTSAFDHRRPVRFYGHLDPSFACRGAGYTTVGRHTLSNDTRFCVDVYEKGSKLRD